MSRVLITGPSGFLGRHCLQRLILEDCEIHAVNSRGVGISSDRVRWYAADLRDPSAAQALVAAIRPTHLLHLAWEATPRLYNQSPNNFHWLQASVAMALAFGEHGGRRFVGVGSSAEYEARDEPCVEDETPIRPSSIYGKCKVACWYGVSAAAQHYRFSAAWGRVFLPYGPGDPAARLIPSVMAALQEKRPVETTHGGQLRDFVYAPDAADLLVRLLFSSETGVFNIGTGCGTTIRTVIEYLADRCCGHHLLRFGALAPPDGEPLQLMADMTKSMEKLGWVPATSITDGLDRSLAEATRAQIGVVPASRDGE
jgi:nucleoside-diphosphate-sugar epimerase